MTLPTTGSLCRIASACSKPCKPPTNSPARLIQTSATVSSCSASIRWPACNSSAALSPKSTGHSRPCLLSNSTHTLHRRTASLPTTQPRSSRKFPPKVLLMFILTFFLFRLCSSVLQDYVAKESSLLDLKTEKLELAQSLNGNERNTNVNNKS